MRFRSAGNLAFAPLAAALLGCAACGFGGGDAPPPYVRVAIRAEPSTLDPARAVTVVEGEVLAKVYEGLLRFEGRRIVGALAETWTISPDGRTYTFRLRDGVRFHDGSILDAADVAASFRRLLDPATASPRTWVLADLEGAEAFAAGKRQDLPGVETPDPRTVVLRLAAPRGAFLALLAMPNAAVLPAETPLDPIEHPVGTGPFRFAEWKRNDRLRLVSYDGYHGGDVAVAGIEYRVIPNDLTAWSFYKAGRIDVMEVPPSLRPQIEASDLRGRLLRTEALATTYVAIQCERFDLPFRRALAASVPAEEIVSTILHGAGRVARSPVPPVLRMEGAELPAPFAPKGVDRSRPLVLLRSSSRASQEPAEAIAAFLREAGFSVEVESMEWTAMKSRVGRGDFDLAYMSWYADYPDPENFLIPLFHSKNVGAAGNRARLRDAEIDRLLEELRAASPGPLRDRLVAAAEARVVSLAPWILLWHPVEEVLVSERVEGWEVPAVYNAFTAAKVRIRDRT